MILVFGVIGTPRQRLLDPSADNGTVGLSGTQIRNEPQLRSTDVFRASGNDTFHIYPPSSMTVDVHWTKIISPSTGKWLCVSPCTSVRRVNSCKRSNYSHWSTQFLKIAQLILACSPRVFYISKDIHPATLASCHPKQVMILYLYRFLSFLPPPSYSSANPASDAHDTYPSLRPRDRDR